MRHDALLGHHVHLGSMMQRVGHADA